MIYDFLHLEKSSKTPLYLQLYNSIKENIENGSISTGIKLPSIRKFSEDLSLSRTTIENAYMQLCAEGYIKNLPQRGYYVQVSVPRVNGAKNLIKKTDNINEISAPVKYDFSGKKVDMTSTNLSLWKRYIRNVINCEYLITSYGNPQGEEDLREVLTNYCYSVRGALANSNEIVIGAGTQPLLYLICGLVRENYGNAVAVEGSGFSHAKQVFKDCGINVINVDSNKDGIDIYNLKESGAKILLVNPSGNLETGNIIKLNRRIELIDWAKKYNGIIIEDDYNGELRYSTRPIPAMQCYGKDYVIYLGSFSKLLLPSVRISYMILPPSLIKQYTESVNRYNQTASKMEQLALSKYIRDGHLEKHLRRLRKNYKEKSQVLIKSINENFSNAKISLKETSLSVNVMLKQELDIKEISKKFDENGILIKSIEENENNLELSFSGIDLEDIPKGVSEIKRIINKK